ncbi:LuxR family transcriptional regulator [Aureimonas fodinaquatilis]|uniref:LuxR family transcriptional regulator n=1 Tax=Aureimonas fodinaquatilis TaxID=2565783 RepID=A0A5B0DRT0_9HYPH|nr:LuxR family transcriptional regulator [Aureimonas fodinaquatilis]KAA0968451.1 LuxR family transcriptional regulator [Aureimonas fodinaquatilis]
MAAEGQTVWSLLTGVQQPVAETRLQDLLTCVASLYGYSHAGFVTLDRAGSELELILSNWDEDFTAAYEAQHLNRYSPIVRALKADPEPFVWTVESLFGYDPTEPETFEGPVQFLLGEQLCGGMFLPVHGLTGFCGAISFLGGRSSPSTAEINEMRCAGFALFGMLAAFRFEENRLNNPLSQREKDCLKLAMLGKTSSEIGSMISLSEYTVSQHLASATRKMGAANRTHAVAMAAQLGYLS